MNSASPSPKNTTNVYGTIWNDCNLAPDHSVLEVYRDIRTSAALMYPFSPKRSNTSIVFWMSFAKTVERYNAMRPLSTYTWSGR